VTDGLPPVRPASPAEFGRLRSIELDSDRLLETVGIGPFENDDGHDRLAKVVAVFAAGDPPVGFVSIDVIDGCAHIDQLSVLRDHGGHGIGRALLDEAVRWARADGLAAVTLTTFRDVPWNAPFYRRVGFEVVDDPTPGLAAVRTAERAEGLDRFGPRVAMRLAL
jgi:GNAT superfamily N-acetyltransferase